MRLLFLGVLLWGTLYAAPASCRREPMTEQIKSAIVKIYTVYKNRHFLEPWNVSIARSTGSGAIISGNRILTNAHVIANHTFIEVKHHGETTRYKAHVIAVSDQADLALLGVDDASFFENTTPLQLDKLPKLQEEVSIYGFPTGGTMLSITDGVISRIEHHRYKHSGESFLALQVDAAINPGNSGGPALAHGKIVGVVMQIIRSAQNIGYLVPTPVIRHFLEDLKDGWMDGFAATGFMTESLQNPTLKRYYGLDDNETGQLVVSLPPICQGKGVQAGDIITAIDGHRIEDDGTVEFRPHEYTSYKYYIDLHQMHESITLDLIRAGKRLHITFPLEHQLEDFMLVKQIPYGKMPTYFIYGGYIFSPLTRNLLRQIDAPLRLRQYLRQWPTDTRKDIVVLIKVLADESNRGNHGVHLWPILKLDHKDIASFEAFYRAIYTSRHPFALIEDDEGYQIAIDRNTSLRTLPALLKRYNILSDRSEDLKSIKLR